MGSTFLSLTTWTQHRINSLKSYQVLLLFFLIAITTFYHGLFGQFQGDDIPQIVDNLPVHSISHFKLFFEGGTFYNGRGLDPLTGGSYRPLMTLSFSFIYSLFGPHPFYFHLLQLILGVGIAFILYLFFKYSFSPGLALLLATIFLLHPLNSQVLYAIPSMQESLFMFFGLLGVFILVKYRSTRSLIAASLCLLLSLISKETGILFVIVSILYIFGWRRTEIRRYLVTLLAPLTIWATLRINAVGIVSAHPHNASIDGLGLIDRLMNVPSIILFYFSKFVFPYRLSSGYYWSHSTPTLKHFALPLVLVLAILLLIIFMGHKVKVRGSKANRYTYFFFAAWLVIGLLLHLQIVPLDFTISEPWFYFPMIGLLGLIGTAVTTLKPKLNLTVVYCMSFVLILILGVRTSIRADDWQNPYTLASEDIIASPENYNAFNQVAIHYYDLGDFQQASLFAKKSVKMYPTGTNNATLGGINFALGNYKGAYESWNNGLKYQPYYFVLYKDLALLTEHYGSLDSNRAFLHRALKIYPHSGELWLSLAHLEYQHQNLANAKAAVAQAFYYDSTNPSIVSDYNIIMGM